MIQQWPKNPDIYEINTRLWVKDLSAKYGKSITLGTVPDDELKQLQERGFDALWLMGVWTPSPAGERIARSIPALRRGYLKALPDLQEEDILASPYAVKDYTVNPALGGEKGLVQLRQRMRENGLKLILDFVPNHVAIDHPWTTIHPEYFVRGDENDLARDPDTFFNATPDAPPGITPAIIAHGKDPYFPAWTDTAQLNYLNPSMRLQMINVLLDIAEKADGVRCDMAMLVLNGIHYHIWRERLFKDLPEIEYQTEFWSEAIETVKRDFPDFVFIAEAYWMKEGELQQLGFDYTYDKALYDWLRTSDVMNIRRYIKVSPFFYQERCVRFIENHDEERARAVFGQERERCAALLAGTLPGAHLYHEGQLEGFCIKYPVQLGRRQSETVDADLKEYYKTILKAAKSFRNGKWTLLSPYPAWEENVSYVNFIIYTWNYGDLTYLIVVNYSPYRSQCYVPLPLEGIEGRKCQLVDMLHENYYERDGDILSTKGLYLDIRGFYRHMFKIE